MEIAQRHDITDTCVLVRDLEASIAFYRDKLGVAPQRRSAACRASPTLPAPAIRSRYGNACISPRILAFRSILTPPPVS